MATITAVVDLASLRVGVTLAAWVDGPVVVTRVHQDGSRVEVRDVPDASGAASFAYDYETPLGESFYYEAHSGASLITSPTVTVSVTDAYVSVPGMPGSAMRIDVEEVPEATMSRPVVELDSPFRSVPPVEFGELQAPAFPLILQARSVAQRAMVEQLLKSGVLLVRMPLTEYAAVYALPSQVTRSPWVPWRRQDSSADSVADWRRYAMACRTTSSPVGASYGDPTASYQALVDSGRTYQAVLDWHVAGATTYLDLLRGGF